MGNCDVKVTRVQPDCSVSTIQTLWQVNCFPFEELHISLYCRKPPCVLIQVSERKLFKKWFGAFVIFLW